MTSAPEVDGEPGRCLTDYLAAQRDAIVRTCPLVSAGNGEAIHDMRVATRRLRSTFVNFRPMLAPVLPQSLPDELRWLGGLLGAVRDGDVLDRRLTKVVEEQPPELVIGPVAARIHDELAAPAEQAQSDLNSALASRRVGRILHQLDALVEAGPPAVTGRELLDRTAKAVRRADRRLAVAQRPPESTHDTPEAEDRNVRLHEARKAYKRARYAVEVLRPLVGNPAKRLAKRLTVLQDMLGAHQDAVVAAQLLRDYGLRADLAGENAFTYGLLYEYVRVDGEQRLAGLARVRRRAGTQRVREWLT